VFAEGVGVDATVADDSDRPAKAGNPNFEAPQLSTIQIIHIFNIFHISRITVHLWATGGQNGQRGDSE